MSNNVFPSLPGLAWGLTRTPVWNTRVQKSASGMRQAIAYMSYPLYRWTLNFNVLREFAGNNELETLQAFFNNLKGMYDTFLFADPNDAAVTSFTSFGTGNGSNKLFQLVRPYGGYIEPVQSPNTYTVRKASVTMSEPSQFTMGPTGIVTFVTAPANGTDVNWMGTFRWRCAFTQDTIDFINQDGVDIWKTNKIAFESVKQ